MLRDGYMELLVPKPFEYIALGVPAVAPDLPGIRSYFDEDQLVYSGRDVPTSRRRSWPC